MSYVRAAAGKSINAAAGRTGNVKVEIVKGMNDVEDFQ